jgi:chromosome segregation ATPase
MQAAHSANVAWLAEKLKEAGATSQQQQEATSARLQGLEAMLRDEQRLRELQRGQLSQRLEEAQGRLQQHEQRAAEEQRQHTAEVAALKQELAAARQEAEATESAHKRALQAAVEGAVQRERDLQVIARIGGKRAACRC